MKKLFIAAALLCSALSIQAQATVTLPAASTPSITLQWTLDSTCSTTTPCTITPYRQQASACPTGALGGTTGWTQLPATASQATSTNDATVASGVTYIYVVEAAYSGGANSAPSNCIAVTAPNVPGAPTALTHK